MRIARLELMELNKIYIIVRTYKSVWAGFVIDKSKLVFFNHTIISKEEFEFMDRIFNENKQDISSWCYFRFITK